MLKYKIAPLAPQVLTIIYYCNEGYGLLKYKTDRYGFRNNENLWNNKKVYIILIGYSFTQGACVHFNDSITRKLTKHFDVINLGTSGNGPIYYASLLKELRPILKADFVYILFYPNNNILNEKNH